MQKTPNLCPGPLRFPRFPLIGGGCLLYSFSDILAQQQNESARLVGPLCLVLYKMVSVMWVAFDNSGVVKASVHEWVNLGGVKPFIAVVLYKCTPFAEVYVKLLGTWVEKEESKQSDK